MKVAIYFSAGLPDAGVERGLAMAGCKLQQTRTVAETINALKSHGVRLRTIRTLRKKRSYEAYTPVLIAEVQSGGLALLEMLNEQKIEVPPTLLIDYLGTDIQVPLRAIQLGVRDYLLPEDNLERREQRAKQLVERFAVIAAKQTVAPAAAARRSAPGRYVPYGAMIEAMRWDPVSHTIHIGDDDFLRLSPMEGRTFDLLYTRRGDTVSIDELIESTLSDKDDDPMKNIQLLRTHLARLRRRLSDYPHFGYRIENMRGTGYTLI